jgi:hypothetical protein
MSSGAILKCSVLTMVCATSAGRIRRAAMGQKYQMFCLLLGS